MSGVVAPSGHLAKRALPLGEVIAHLADGRGGGGYFDARKFGALVDAFDGSCWITLQSFSLCAQYP